MDDVTFGRNGPYGDAWKAEPSPTTASGIAIPGRSLTSIECLVLLLFSKLCFASIADVYFSLKCTDMVRIAGGWEG